MFDTRPRIVTPYHVAMRFDGTKEIPGKPSNPIILAWLKRYGSWINSEDTPWCSAFVNFCADEAGYESTKKLNARSWLKVGKEVPVLEAQEGDVVVLWRGSPTSWQGHVAFFVEFENGVVWLFGGNQGDKVCRSPYSMSKVLGVRRLRPLGV